MSPDTNHPELAAVESVYKALQPLDQESRQRVLNAVGSLLHVTAAIAPPVQAIPSSAQAQASPAAQTTSPRPTIYDFVAGKRPIDYQQRLACLAYYMEHFENKSPITSKDLTQANSEARQPKIDDIGRTLSDATLKAGYFAPAGGSKRVLSARGKAVVEALPDEEAVRQALEAHPRPVRRSRKPKTEK